MGEVYKILVINPGSTSTKIAVYDNETEILDETIRHKKEELMKFDTIPEQKDFRFKEIERVLKEHDLDFSDIDAVASRGGIIKPMASGTYDISEKMLEDLVGLKSAALHASSLAGLIGYDLKKKYNIPAYVVDPVVVDEYQDVARLTGIPGVDRVSTFHALNQKAIARECAKDFNKKYEECNFVVAHMGGGISVCAHRQGLAVDGNNAISGEGAFSPERIGDVAPLRIAQLCYEEGYSLKDITDLCTKVGGMSAHIGTNDLRDCEAMIEEGDEKALLVFRTMAYQVAKLIGAMSVVLHGKVDAIVLTGGLAYSKNFTKLITEQVEFIAPVKLYPGEFEIIALVKGVLGVLNGEITPKKY